MVYCGAVRSPILATAWLLVEFEISTPLVNTANIAILGTSRRGHHMHVASQCETDG